MERNKRRKRRGKKWKRIGKRRRRDRQLTARSNFSDLSRPRPRRVIQLRQPSWKGRGNTHRVRAPRPSIDPPTLSISRIPRPHFSITPVFLYRGIVARYATPSNRLFSRKPRLSGTSQLPGDPPRKVQAKGVQVRARRKAKEKRDGEER